MPESSTPWREVRLEEVAQVSPESLGTATPPDYRFRYIDLSSVSQGSIDWQSVEEIRFLGAPSRARRVARPGDVLFGTVRPALKSHAAIPLEPPHPDLVASTGFAVVRATSGKSDPRFLLHYVLGPHAAAEARSREVGSNYPAVNESDVRRFRVLLPPLPEQRRIAEILDTVDDAIRKTEEIIAKLKQVKQGLLHDLLTRGIDDNGELRDPDRQPEQFKDSPLGRIPNAWEVVPCGDLFDVQLGKMMSPAAAVGSNQKPYLRNQNVYWDRLDLSDVATMHFEGRDLEKFRLEPGDLLACEGRFIGRCALWRGEMAECFYQKALHRLRARTERATTDFMLFFMSFRFEYDTRFVKQMTHESTIPHLPLEKLLRLRVLTPPPSEQAGIISRMRALTDRIEAEKQQRLKLSLTKSGLMEDLLSGRVRVTPLLEDAPQ